MSFISNQPMTGQAMCYAALTLSLATTLLGRHYSRSIYFAQLLFIFSAVYPDTTDAAFSLNLGYSWVSFIPTFLSNYCTTGDYVCTNGYLLTSFIGYIGGAIGLFIIVKLLSCKFKSLQFLKVYSFYRGLSYWFFAPLAYVSAVQIIQSLNTGSYDKNFIYAAGAMGALLVMAIMELISAKVAQRQEQNIWRKWIQFLSHINVALCMALVALYKYSSQASTARYMLNVPLVFYALIFLVKYKFTYSVVERLSAFLQDAAIIVVYNVYVIKYQYVPLNYLDFYSLALVLILELLFLLPKLVKFFKGDDEEGSLVNPEKELKQVGGAKKRQDVVEPDIYPNESFEGLRSSQLYANSNQNSTLKQPQQRSPPKRR